MTPEPSPENEAVVRVRNGPLVAPVLSRVVGMLAARAQSVTWMRQGSLPASAACPAMPRP